MIVSTWLTLAGISLGRIILTYSTEPGQIYQQELWMKRAKSAE